VHELSRILFEVLRCGSVHARIWCHPSTVENLSAGLRSVKKLTQQNVLRDVVTLNLRNPVQDMS